MVFSTKSLDEIREKARGLPVRERVRFFIPYDVFVEAQRRGIDLTGYAAFQPLTQKPEG